MLIDLDSTGGICITNSVLGEGIYTEIERIVLQGKISKPSPFKMPWVILYFASAPIATVAISIRPSSSLLTTTGIIGLVTLTIIFVIELWYQDHYNTIILRSRKESPNFWERNKDQIIILLLGGVIGAILTKIFGG